MRKFRAAPPKPSAPLAPTDPLFEATGEVAAAYRESWSKVPRALIEHRQVLRTGLQTLRALPRIDVTLPDTPAARELTAEMRTGLRTRTLAVAVLEMPTELESYRRGKARRMMRNRAAQARSMGATCMSIGAADLHPAVRGLSTDTWKIDPASPTYAEWLGAQLPAPWMLLMLACGEHGKPINFAKVIVVGQHARLHTFIRDESDPASSSARFLLMDHLIEQLHARDIRYLFTDTVVGLPGGLRFQQKVLGFSVYNVKARLTR